MTSETTPDPTEEPEPQPEPAQLPIAPAAVREAVSRELADLDTFIQGISVDAWSVPSRASGWNTGDVVAHLDLALGVYSRVLDASLAGRGSGVAWKAFGKLTQKVVPAASPALNAINSAIPRVVRGALSPEVLKGQFTASSRSFRHKLDGIESPDFMNPIHYMGRPWPLSFFLASVLNELAVHGWDMRSPLAPASHIAPMTRAVLPWFYWSGTPFMFRPKPTFRGTVQASLFDPDIALWWSAGESNTKQGTGSAAAAEATISAESGTFVLMLSRRIDIDDALKGTATSIAGNAEMAKDFLRSWKIV
ncbi:MAG: maleylpyruvate isomerase N-terminal domain-containing protein [Chloroflexota bacterium]